MYSAESIYLLRYCISKGNLSPDPHRLKPLQDVPILKTNKELRRVICLLALYAHWISHYSNRVTPLVDMKYFLSVNKLFHASRKCAKFWLKLR